jgi:hypothetical protein
MAKKRETRCRAWASEKRRDDAERDKHHREQHEVFEHNAAGRRRRRGVMRHATPSGLRHRVCPRRSRTPRTASTGRRGRRRPVSPRERGPAGGSSRNPARRGYETPMSGTHRAMASGKPLWDYHTLAQRSRVSVVALTFLRPFVCARPHASEPKPIKVLPDGAVTLARCPLERGAIQNRHVAMDVLDQPGLLKRPRHQCDGRPR